ncbi:6-bladed beta-propeller [candidate division KSB1 bacterium]
MHNISPLWGDEERLNLEFVQKIGELEGDDENYMFYFPNDVDRDKYGNIYILEAGNCRIQKFDTDGNYLATIGNKGQGPGEFDNPYDLEIDDSGNIFVYNQPLKILKLNPEGKYFDTFPASRFTTSFEVLKNGNLIFANMPIGIKDSIENLLTICDDQGKTIIDCCIQGIPIVNNPIGTFNLFFCDTDQNDNIIVDFYHQNRIEKYNPFGKQIFKMDRKLGYEITHKETEYDFTYQGATITLPTIRYSIISVLAGIDHKNRIWEYFRKRQPADGEKINDDNIDEYSEIRIYDNDGIFLTKIPNSSVKQGSLIIKNDRLYSITKDMCVYEYRIVDK